MNRICHYFFFFLSLYTIPSYAQGNKYDISAPIDISATGVDKVLCMKNGNTMLFHFESAKRISVIVFDSLHKEIANSKEPCKVLDILTLEHVTFKGLFEINNEAVLFFDQDHNGKHSLVRLCYNSRNGMLRDETLVAESKGENKKMQFFVMKNKGDDNYAILFCTDKHHPKECDIFVAYFDKDHKSVKEIQLEVDRKKYDNLEITGAELQPNGVCVSIDLGILKENGVPAMSSSGREQTAAVYDHYLALFYIPQNSATAKTAMIHLSTEVYPFYTNYTYNPFANTLNLLLLSFNSVQYKFGLEWLPAAVIQHLFFTIDAGSMDVNYKWMRNKLASDAVKRRTDTTAFFEGLPVSMFTNENGLSTVISASFSRYWEPETRVRNDRYTYFGNIGITQLDDNGNEIWGTVLPLRQRFKSYHQYYYPADLSKKWQSQVLFGDLPEAVYERQFVSINPFYHDKNFYLVYNDNNGNFNNSIEQPSDTVYNFNITNACYYKLNREKKITKHYLYGEPVANEYKCAFIEGADFDEQRGVYASLIQYRKDGDISLRMAWSHLE